jgi:hypothetical protein
VYLESAREAFERLSPQQMMQFAQYLQQQAGQRRMNVPDLNRPGTDERFQDPGFLANILSGMDRQQPGMLAQLFGGGGGRQGQQGGDMLSNPLAKAALAGIAAIAFRKMTGR